MQNPHAIIQYAIENPVGISNERKHTHSRPFDDARCGFRVFGDVTDDGTNTHFKCRNDGIAECGPAIG